MTWSIIAMTLAAGAGGAVLRAAAVSRSPGIGTDVVNVLGTGLLAVVSVLLGAGRVGVGTAAVLGLGLCGSLTTFSGWIAELDGTASAARRALRVVVPLGAAVALTIVANVLIG